MVRAVLGEKFISPCIFSRLVFFLRIISLWVRNAIDDTAEKNPVIPGSPGC